MNDLSDGKQKMILDNENKFKFTRLKLIERGKTNKNIFSSEQIFIFRDVID